MTEKEINFEEWDRKRAYYNKILFIIASLIAIALVWGMIVTGVIK